MRKFNLIFKIFCVLGVLIFTTTAIFVISPIKPARADNCGTDLAPATRGWSCVDTTTREGGNAGCRTGLCTGPATRMCCPPPGAEGAGGEGGGGEAGGEVGAGLKEAAGVAGIEKFDIATKIGDIISAALGFVGIIFLILMIVGGLMWMTAGGSEEKIGKAKKLIVSAVIGIIIVFSAYAITYFVTTTLLGG